MFEKRNISEEEALKRACKQNGFEFVPNNKKPRKTITIVNDEGKETVLDNNFNIVKSEDTVRMQEVMKFTKAAVATVIDTVNAPRVGGSGASKPKIAGHYRLSGVGRKSHAAKLSETKVIGVASGRSRTTKHGVSRTHKGVTHTVKK
jgi:hypothetical protein